MASHGLWDRDSQRSKVYAAEQSTFNLFGPNPNPMTIEECQAYVNKLLASKWLIKKYGKRRVRVIRGRGGGHAYANSMTLGAFAQRPCIIIHELAHILAPWHVMHGWEFCEIYLDLVRHFMGKDHHDLLKAQFKANRVKFTEPRAKRPITPEQKAVLVERLAAARAKKMDPSLEATS